MLTPRHIQTDTAIAGRTVSVHNGMARETYISKLCPLFRKDGSRLMRYPSHRIFNFWMLNFMESGMYILGTGPILVGPFINQYVCVCVCVCMYTRRSLYATTHKQPWRSYGWYACPRLTTTALKKATFCCDLYTLGVNNCTSVIQLSLCAHCTCLLCYALRNVPIISASLLAAYRPVRL
jgi:hypothetical protein